MPLCCGHLFFFGYWIGYWIEYGADADMGISCNVMVREDVWSVKHCSALSIPDPINQTTS